MEQVWFYMIANPFSVRGRNDVLNARFI